MKALISPNEVFNYKWVSSWEIKTTQEGNEFIPVYSEITNCQRVAQVVPDNEIFEVSLPLYWLDCDNNCVADQYYYKDGNINLKPQDVDRPN